LNGPRVDKFTQMILNTISIAAWLVISFCYSGLHSQLSFSHSLADLLLLLMFRC